MNSPDILGVKIDPISLDDILGFIQSNISSGRRALIAHVNIHGLNLAYENEWLRKFYADSDLVYCDGMGVKLGARFLGYKIPHRLTLADWVWQLAELCENRGYSMFLLGNPPGSAAKAAADLRGNFPKLDIRGAQHGYFNKSLGSSENAAVQDAINAEQPDILLVGFGMPLQEKWLAENWEFLDVKIAITVGGLFEYMTGQIRRGKPWLTQNYMEWLTRLFIAPQRYFLRYLKDIPVFFWRLVKQRNSMDTLLN